MEPVTVKKGDCFQVPDCLLIFVRLAPLQEAMAELRLLFKLTRLA